MGGIGIAGNQALYLNPINPAGYSELYLTTFELGVNASLSKQISSKVEQNNNTASLGYFAFGFPAITKKWGLGFGLLPYSNVGYSVEEVTRNDLNQPEFRTYAGSGGLNQFYLNNGVSLAKNLSFGVTASYLFGVINQDRRVEFTDPSYFNTSVSNSNAMGWFHYNFGLLYTFDSLSINPSDSINAIDEQLKVDEVTRKNIEFDIASTPDELKKTTLIEKRMKLDSTMETRRLSRDAIQTRTKKSDWHLSFGLTLAPSANLRGRESMFAYNFKYLTPANNQEVIRDTIVDTEGVEGVVKLPLSAGFGVAVKKGNRWLIGADFTVQQWSDYTYFGQSDSLVDSWKIALGLQYTPNERAVKSYLRQIQYRAGYHYSRSFLELQGIQLEEMGASIGLGFPFRRVGTTVQFSTEIGKRGTIQNGLIEEKYIRFSLGFTLNDRWFIKPKYD